MQSERQADIPAEIKVSGRVAENAKEFEQAGSIMYADAYAGLSVAKTKTSSPDRLGACGPDDANDVAKALDDGREFEASLLLRSCLYQSIKFNGRPVDYRTFAESVSALEAKGDGYDLNLKYTFDLKSGAIYLNDTAIK